MTYKVMAITVMAYVVMALRSYGLSRGGGMGLVHIYSYGLCSRGLRSYGLHS